MQKLFAILITVALVVLCFCTVIFFTEGPLLFLSRKAGKKYAAIAIRDNVNSFQKFGTRLFTYPCLEKNYETFSYFTQNGTGDKKEDFLGTLSGLLKEHDSLDIFLLAHSNQYYQWMNEVEDTSLLKKVRLVYNTGCSGYLQASQWKAAGAKYYVAHQSSQSISPVFYFYFLRRYCSGEPLHDAISEANTAMHGKLKRLKTLSFGRIGVDETTEKESEGASW